MAITSSLVLISDSNLHTKFRMTRQLVIFILVDMSDHYYQKHGKLHFGSIISYQLHGPIWVIYTLPWFWSIMHIIHWILKRMCVKSAENSDRKSSVAEPCHGSAGQRHSRLLWPTPAGKRAAWWCPRGPWTKMVEESRTERVRGLVARGMKKWQGSLW